MLSGPLSLALAPAATHAERDVKKRNTARKRINAALLGALALLVVVAGWSGSASAQDSPEGNWVCDYQPPGPDHGARVNFDLFLRRTSATTAEIYDGYGSLLWPPRWMYMFHVTAGGTFSATPGDTINFATKTRNSGPPGSPSGSPYLPPNSTVNRESWLVTNSSPLTFTVTPLSGATHLVNVSPGGSGKCYPLR
jgi:hypothetical protein